jgi:tol-pal system-associated acyl-CoA thioesterase
MRFKLSVRVYLEDTDAQGVVYNASYFRFMERARTECVRAAGVDHTALRAEHGVSLVLASIEARFKAPARLDDLLEVSAEVTHVQGARVVFRQEIRRGDGAGEMVCEGVAEVACVGAADGRPRRLPRVLTDMFTAPSAAPTSESA